MPATAEMKNTNIFTDAQKVAKSFDNLKKDKLNYPKSLGQKI